MLTTHLIHAGAAVGLIVFVYAHRAFLKAQAQKEINALKGSHAVLVADAKVAIDKILTDAKADVRAVEKSSQSVYVAARDIFAKMDVRLRAIL